MSKLSKKTNSVQSARFVSFVKFSALGDIIWSVPVVRTLRQKYPASTQVSWITSPLFAELLKNAGLPEEGITIIAHPKPQAIADYLVPTRRIKHHCDILYAAQSSLRINLFYPQIKATLKIGLDPYHARDGQRFFVNQQAALPLKEQQHELTTLLNLIGATADEMAPAKELFRLSVAESFLPLQLQSPCIVIAPCASSPARTLPLLQQQILVKKIIDSLSPMKVILIGGQQDFAFANQLLLDSNRILNLCGKTSLTSLAALLAHPQVKAVIGPDSGPLHLADAQGKKTIGLYAAVPPELTGPWHNIHHCLNKYDYQLAGKRDHRAQLMDVFKVEEIWQSLIRLL